METPGVIPAKPVLDPIGEQESSLFRTLRPVYCRGDGMRELIFLKLMGLGFEYGFIPYLKNNWTLHISTIKTFEIITIIYIINHSNSKLFNAVCNNVVLCELVRPTHSGFVHF